MAEEEKREVSLVFEGYGLTAQQSLPIVEALAQKPEAWVDFMMRFELGLEAPEPGRALRSALTIALAYICGGMIPLSPYFFGHSSSQSLLVSICVTLVALAVFGYLKGRATGAPAIRSGLQTTLIGGLAAAAAFALAKAIS
jgi:VIT1/CCC1 family predicted Fe2+/Mn2+ transporter